MSDALPATHPLASKRTRRRFFVYIRYADSDIYRGWTLETVTQMRRTVAS